MFKAPTGFVEEQHCQQTDKPFNLLLPCKCRAAVTLWLRYKVPAAPPVLRCPVVASSHHPALDRETLNWGIRPSNLLVIFTAAFEQPRSFQLRCPKSSLCIRESGLLSIRDRTEAKPLRGRLRRRYYQRSGRGVGSRNSHPRALVRTLCKPAACSRESQQDLSLLSSAWLPCIHGCARSQSCNAAKRGWDVDGLRMACGLESMFLLYCRDTLSRWIFSARQEVARQ